jgi:YesN/AraC family two-component response regulator
MGKAKILIVDDEKIILTAYAKELKMAGYEALRAMTGKEAIEIARKEKPDIVFTDLVMHEMNGVEVCKKIKEIRPETEVVLISGYPEEIQKFQMDFIDAGGREEWLRKPLGQDELPETAKKIMKEIEEKKIKYG